MKGGLHQAALAQMELAFAGEQSFAQQDLGALQHAALDEVALAGDQDVLDEFGVVEEEGVHAGRAGSRRGRRNSRCSCIRNVDRVAAEAGEVPEDGRVLGSRGV